jgi:hypothetical protein
LLEIEKASPINKETSEQRKDKVASFVMDVAFGKLPTGKKGLPKTPVLQNPQLQAEEVDYFERKKTEVQKELDALKGSDIKTLNRKLELNQVAARLDEKAKSLREQYGVTTVKEKELPVLTPEEVLQQPPGTIFQTIDGRIRTVSERK